MALIGDKEKEQIQEIFSEGLGGPAKLLMFTQETECEFCSQTRELAQEVAALSDRVEVQIHDFLADADVAAELGIDKIPAIVVVGAKDYGVRFYGIPSGYEFTTLIEAIVNVSLGQSGLSEESVQALANVSEPVHLQVFVTPT